MYVIKRENPIVNRLNKTKVVREVDHENEKIERIKEENAVKRLAAAAKVRPPHLSFVLSHFKARFRGRPTQNSQSSARQTRLRGPMTRYSQVKTTNTSKTQTNRRSRSESSKKTSCDYHRTKICPCIMQPIASGVYHYDQLCSLAIPY